MRQGDGTEYEKIQPKAPGVGAGVRPVVCPARGQRLGYGDRGEYNGGGDHHGQGDGERQKGSGQKEPGAAAKRAAKKHRRKRKEAGGAGQKFQGNPGLCGHFKDEKSISDLIRINLTDAGYSCICAFDGMEAADLIENERFDLILLDIMLPKINGYELMEYIKPLEIPVIFISAKSETYDKVMGLKLGADDYLTKPFEIIELLARVETVLRRYNKNSSIITEGDVVIDINSHIVKKNGTAIPLTVKEFDLLLMLVQNKNIALFREKIFERVWDETYIGDSRTIDLHIQRLRKKLGWEKKIVAVYKIGYRLEGD